MVLLSFIGIFILSFYLTIKVKNYALNKQFIDIPNERSSHFIPTPKGGGIAIVVSFYLALLLLFLTKQIEPSVFYALLGLIAIALIGFFDDRQHIRASYRLPVHFFSALWLCYWLGLIPLSMTLFTPFFMTTALWILTTLYLVWLLNLYNFMDGIDGLAIVEAISVIVSVLFLLWLKDQTLNTELLLLILASLIGFLYWNWPPAKIFMGDVGSAFIGLLLGALSLLTANNGSLDFGVWLILLAVFIADSTYTLLVRLFRGEKIYQAHCSHAYQILSRQYSHRSVTISVLLINLMWLLPLAWTAEQYPSFLWACLLFAYIPLLVIARINRAGEKNT